MARNDLERVIDAARTGPYAKTTLESAARVPGFLTWGLVAGGLVLISLAIHLFWPER